MFPTQFSHPFLHLNSPVHILLFFSSTQLVYILTKNNMALKNMYIITHTVITIKGEIHSKSLFL